MSNTCPLYVPRRWESWNIYDIYMARLRAIWRVQSETRRRAFLEYKLNKEITFIRIIIKIISYLLIVIFQFIAGGCSLRLGHVTHSEIFLARADVKKRLTRSLSFHRTYCYTVSVN